jgi:hypothetical protein
MAERQQRKFNSQHVADRRFHGGAHSLLAAFLALLASGLNWRILM